MNKLDAIFYPKSIAIIGASRKPGSVGHSLLANLIDSRFQGIVYPVNPQAKGILGIKCYPNVIENSRCSGFGRNHRSGSICP